MYASPSIILPSSSYNILSLTSLLELPKLHRYSFTLYLYTKGISQYIRNLDVMSDFSTTLRSKNI